MKDVINIQLNELKTDVLKSKAKHEKLIYSVNIGGIVKYFKSESGADRYLHNLGYRLQTEPFGYTKTHKSDDELFYERNCIGI